MARQFYALNGEVPIRHHTFPLYASPNSSPLCGIRPRTSVPISDWGSCCRCRCVLQYSARVPRFRGQVRKQAGVIGPTFTARAGSQIQQSTSALSHFRDIVDLRHFGDGYIF